jgi:hypothetical protein
MQVVYRLSEEFRSSRFIETGVRPEAEQVLEFNPAELSRETREFITKRGWLNTHKPSASLAVVDVVIGYNPSYTVDYTYDVEAHNVVAQEFFDTFRVAAEAAEVARRKQCDIALADFLVAGKWTREFNVPDITKFASPGMREQVTSAAAAAYSADKALKDKLAAEAAARKAAEEAAALAAREARAADKLAWIEAHGSDFLRKAIANDFNCQRAYVTERAGIELPGFEIDFDDKAAWDSRSCPGEKALDEVIALKARGFEADVVWLTTNLDGEELFHANDDRDEIVLEYQHEAVVARNYLGKYDAVKSF